MYQGKYMTYEEGFLNKEDIIRIAKFLKENETADIDIVPELEQVIITVYGTKKDFDNFEKIYWED